MPRHLAAPQRRWEPRRVLSGAGTGALVVIAFVIVGWVVFSALTGATLLTFKTGSMAPTMPQGALAVAIPVTADELEVGDVVTVERGPGELPVTHRVVQIRLPGPEVIDPPASARELILQGDDNASPDARPYHVSQARRVVLAVPRAGAALMRERSPIGMGVLVIGAGGLVTWAFWPRYKEDDEG